jgi:hypothetical protein
LTGQYPAGLATGASNDLVPPIASSLTGELPDATISVFVGTSAVERKNLVFLRTCPASI